MGARTVNRSAKAAMYFGIKQIISHVRLFVIISHVKIIAFQAITYHSFWTFYIGGKPVVFIYDKQKNTWVLGNTILS